MSANMEYLIPEIKGKVETVVTYLEMKSPPAVSSHGLPGEAEVRKAPAPDLGFYRSLYDGVGRNYTWTARKLMPDAVLSGIVHDPAVEVHVLYVSGEPAGFVEFDRRGTPEVEISMFGLFPAYHGRKLGPGFINWAVGHAWREMLPRRLWLHTCTLDHPKALAMYLKAGFVKYDERRESVDLI